jgi:hydrogenase maturation protein HypF
MHQQSVAGSTRVRIRVDGIVQGVGFRPYVHRLATAAGLTGHVGNDAHGVVIEVQGPAAVVDTFVDALSRDAPPLAQVDEVRVESGLPPCREDGFTIANSDGAGRRDVLVSPDVATCDDCLAELWDPADRRHRYPFVNCTNCGPRFTIVRDVPYDRPSTTMAGFAMCAACRAEYEDPTDRRFHAQPVCCPDCGPTLRLVDGDRGAADADPIEGAARSLLAGRVVAVKGLGGYHLAVDATDEAATARLRARKHREDRPFAVLVADVDAAASLCALDEAERALLTSSARPIVLARRHDDAPVAPSVAPGTRELGLLLPYTPLHHLLCAAVDRRPLVLTSGNVSDEPIAHDDEDAFMRLAPIADAFLTHDRPIHTRTDDSVARVVAGTPMLVRRSRGYVPGPVTVPWRFPRHVLACGAELKNTFCLARDRRAFVSHHVGDLSNWETLRAFTDGIAHLARLFDVHPTVVAHDLHPEYLSTKHAIDLADTDPTLALVGVQHHHAHVASCLADNGVDGPVIGVAYDGLGFGTDGTLWGGEVLVADRRDARRVAHLDLAAMPGGAAAVHAPWRMAAAHLLAAGLLDRPTAVADRRRDQWAAVVDMARTGSNAPATSSMGRLFDAVAALVGLRDTVTFEGQAAIALEQAAAPDLNEAYPAGVTDDDPAILRAGDLVRAVVDDLADGVPAPTIAARFHGGVAAMTVGACERARDREGLTTVALSGGVFQNVRLLTSLTGSLQARGFTVLTHHRVPPNDGGISLGQAVVAAARCA